MRLIVLIFITAAFIGCSCTPEKKMTEYTAPYDGKRFHNYDKGGEHTLPDVLKWKINSKKAEWPQWIDSTPHRIPEQRVEGLSVTFINHSTFLIQTENLNILTDPFYSFRASPFSWAGPRRVRAAAVRMEELPPIDMILVSHNHYDHLDKPALAQLHSLFPDAVIYTGIGNKKDISETGFKDIVELDWWEHTNFKDLKITYVPARHFSARTLWDRNKALWGGFVITGKNGNNIFFAGDTGKGVHEEMIAERFDKYELAIIPIGAYNPRWFMKSSHMDPFEAVEMHKIIRSTFSLGAHFGTVQLTDEGINDPLNELTEAKKKAGLTETEFIAPDFGKTYAVR